MYKSWVKKAQSVEIVSHNRSAIEINIVMLNCVVRSISAIIIYNGCSFQDYALSWVKTAMSEKYANMVVLSKGSADNLSFL